MPVNPAELRIVHYPAASLRTKAAPVDRIDDDVRAVAARMIELMRQEEGVGLAAPQVGLPWRMFVTEAPDDGEPMVYINPMLELLPGRRDTHEEGCLSLPGIRVDIERPMAATITAQDLQGCTFSRTSDQFVARVWQHEFDHLNGVLILDKMSTLDRLAMRRAIKDLEGAARPAKI